MSRPKRCVSSKGLRAFATDDAVMYERQTKHQEPRNPIEGANAGDAGGHDAAAAVHRITRPCEHARGREHKCWLAGFKTISLPRQQVANCGESTGQILRP